MTAPRTRRGVGQFKRSVHIERLDNYVEVWLGDTILHVFIKDAGWKSYARAVRRELVRLARRT